MVYKFKLQDVLVNLADTTLYQKPRSVIVNATAAQ